jgi:4-amino-4-deoxy-L-arabinose transferase-like glycosyltransferase
VLLLLCLAAAGSVALFWRLGRSSLQDWDEATYAEIAREIGVFHDWIHLHWNFMPWFNKPPLYIWLTALLFHFGTSTFTARAVSALAGIGVLAVTYLVGHRLHGRLVGVLAALVVLCAYQFVVAARTGQSDMLLTLMIWLALYSYLRTTGGSRLWWYAAGACIGLALLTKGPAALVGPATIFIALLIEGRAATAIHSRDLWAAAALGLAIAVPWHAAQLIHEGVGFLGQYFGYMVIRRASTPLEGHIGTPLTYLIWLRNQFFPWAYLLPFAFVAYLRRIPGRQSGKWLVVVFPILVLGLYSVVASKVLWYMLPIYPALGILVAALLVNALRGDRLAQLSVLAATVAAVLLVPRSLAPPPALWIAAAIVIGCLLGGWAWRSRRSVAPLTALAALFFVAISIQHLAPAYRAGPSPVVAIAHRVKATTQVRQPVLLLIGDPKHVTDYEVSHSLIFYSHRPVRVVIGPDALSAITACARAQPVVLPSADLDLVAAQADIKIYANRTPFVYGVLEGGRPGDCVA